jgi:uncharacterized membrane protein YgcG
MFTFGGL